MNESIAWTESEALACSRRILSSFGCIVELLDDGKGVSRGTVTFVRVGDVSLLLTAEHVASVLIGKQCRVLVLPMEVAGAVVVAAIQVPVAIDFVPELAVSSPEDALDVAFLKCPPELAALPISSFDLVEAVIGLDARRASLPKERNSGYLKADFVCGYPNFAALESESQRIQLMGGSSRQIKLHTLDPSVPGMRPPQLTATLFLDKGKPSGRPIEELFQTRLERQNNPFGGYSGGPIVSVESAQPPRVHLLGSVKAGERFTEGRVVGTPIDASRELLHSVIR